MGRPIRSGLSKSVRSLYFKGAGNTIGTFALIVVGRGGIVSAARIGLLTTLVSSLQAAYSWWLMDDISLLVAENATSALTSLRRFLQMTVTAAPTFTIDRGYAFNGTTQFVDTTFVRANASFFNNNFARISVYERTEVTSTGFACGATTGAGRVLQVRPRNSTTMTGAAVCVGVNFTIAATSLGLTAVSSPAGTTVNGYKNGVILTPATSSGHDNSTGVTVSVYIGGQNNSGALANPRASTIGHVDHGGVLTDAQELATYNAFQTFYTAVGANV
jgi:hypothetical protein